MRYENAFLFSILHLAVYHGREQLAKSLIQQIKQLPETDQPLLDTGNKYQEVGYL